MALIDNELSDFCSADPRGDEHSARGRVTTKLCCMGCDPDEWTTLEFKWKRFFDLPCQLLGLTCAPLGHNDCCCEVV